MCRNEGSFVRVGNVVTGEFFSFCESLQGVHTFARGIFLRTRRKADECEGARVRRDYGTFLQGCYFLPPRSGHN